MKLHGTTEGNLISAVRSAHRLQGSPVHKDTVRFWRDLIAHAQNELSSRATVPSDSVRRLVSDLEVEVARRPH